MGIKPEKVQPVAGSTDVMLESDEQEVRRLAMALLETLNRERANPADGIGGLLLAFMNAAQQGIQLPAEKAGREQNQQQFLKMVDDVRVGIVEVDLSDAASKEVLTRMRIAQLERFGGLAPKGKEVMH